MKRMILFLLAALLLWSVAGAEGVASKACMHEYEKCTEIMEMHNWVVYGEEPEAFLVSAVCRLCNDSCVIIKERELLVPETCAREDCTHRMYTLPAFARMIWLPVTSENGEALHQRVEYDVAVCLDCDQIATVFESKETGEHQMMEKPGFHIEGQYIHVTCKECLMCGLMTGDLLPCIAYGDGTCERTK